MAVVTVEVHVSVLLGHHGPNAADHLLAADVARISGLLSTEVKISRSCARCGSDAHGRPVVLSAEASHVSLSRADGIVLVVVSANAPVGVDVERTGGGGFIGFDEVALHPLETAATPRERSMTWVRKEALVKATGDGLRLDPRQVRLSSGTQLPRLLEWPGEPVPEVRLRDLDLDGYVASLAVLTDQELQLKVRQADPATLVR